MITRDHMNGALMTTDPKTKEQLLQEILREMTKKQGRRK